MHWTEVRIETSPHAADVVVEWLLEFGLSGASVIQTDDHASVCAYLPETADAGGLLERLRAVVERIDPMLTGGCVPSVATELLDEEDWAEAWKRHFRPIRIGRLLIRPSWVELDVAPDDLVIELDPGMAFGTGEHGTTRLCLDALTRRVRPGALVIDVGCGSGVLAIAAARLQAQRVVAIDNDPVAVRVCWSNVQRNTVDGQVEVRLEDGLDSVVEPADVIVANINSEAICRLAPNAAALLRAGGVFIASGMTTASVGRVREAFADAALTALEERCADEWVCLTGAPEPRPATARPAGRREAATAERQRP